MCISHGFFSTTVVCRFKTLFACVELVYVSLLYLTLGDFVQTIDFFETDTVQVYFLSFFYF